MSNIRIIDYKPEDQPYFEKFNREWIEEMFEIEPLDEWVLTNPHEAILQPGGAILMATYNGVIAGTVGLRKTTEAEFEFTKMAVDKNFRRKGIAEALSFASFRKAKDLGAKQIILYSNKRNAGAVLLYEKIGFKRQEVEEGIYKRADVKMIISIEDAIRVADVQYNPANKISYEHQND